jgi:hypothetical protein
MCPGVCRSTRRFKSGSATSFTCYFARRPRITKGLPFPTRLAAVPFKKRSQIEAVVVLAQPEGSAPP